eukprot:scaffold4703_cov108-Cylindrotheca_fusiformis.AAC.13
MMRRQHLDGLEQHVDVMNMNDVARTVEQRGILKELHHPTMDEELRIRPIGWWQLGNGNIWAWRRCLKQSSQETMCVPRWTFRWVT